MKEETKAKLEEAKKEATEIFRSALKESLKQVNARVLPVLIDAATEEIPGKLDDAIAIPAKPIIKEALDAAIEAI